MDLMNNKWIFLLIGVVVGMYVIPAVKARQSS